MLEFITSQKFLWGVVIGFVAGGAAGLLLSELLTIRKQAVRTLPPYDNTCARLQFEERMRKLMEKETGI